METFEEKRRALINQCSMENESDTPDFILSEYLECCLDAFNLATKKRDGWYGHDLGMQSQRRST